MVCPVRDEWLSAPTLRPDRAAHTPAWKDLLGHAGLGPSDPSDADDNWLLGRAALRQTTVPAHTYDGARASRTWNG
ncbi:MAG: hypothetical protein ACYDEY_11005 [Acidimicrobiales bacterium]